MMHNEKKLANIVEELTMYFFAMGARSEERRVGKECRL